MSNVHIAIGRVRGRDSSPTNSPLQVVQSMNSSDAAASQVIASSGTSQVSTVAIPADAGQIIHTYVWEITNMGTNDIYVTFGVGTPVASSTSGKAISAGGVRFFSATNFGEKVAIVNA